MYRKLPHERLAMLDAALEELGLVSEHLSEGCSGSVATCITPDYHDARLSLKKNKYEGVEILAQKPDTGG